MLKSVSVPNWDEYETVFIGYPIWWGDATNAEIKEVPGEETSNEWCEPVNDEEYLAL